MLPDPPHVACLVTVGTEDALLMSADMTINPRAKLRPRRDKCDAVLDLWRLCSQAMGHTACFFIPKGTVGGANILVESVFHNNESF